MHAHWVCFAYNKLKRMSTTHKTRRLTVANKSRILQSGKYSQFQPAIRLYGKWLALAGFSAGQKVTVQCVEGKLIIEPIQSQK